MGYRRDDGFIDPKKEKQEKLKAILGLAALGILILLVLWGALTGRI